MKTEAMLCFKPDGAGHCLYTEAIDLASIGLLQISRVSQIEFDCRRQVWAVCDMKGRELHCSAQRSECLEWEKDHFSSAE